MAYARQHVPVLIASPSDVLAEREIASQTIANWNIANANQYGLYLETKKWETHAAPILGIPGQCQINENLVASADLAIAIFWSRIGSPTGAFASGTVEEINRLINSGKPVLIYFCNRPLPQKHDHTQFLGVQDFKNVCREDPRIGGMTWDFDTVEELGNLLTTSINIHQQQ